MIAATMRRPTGAAPVSFRIVLRSMQMLLLTACFLAALGSAQARIVTVASSDPATVQNVQIADFYGHSVVLRWAAPTQSGAVPTSGYYITWQAARPDRV